MSSKAPASKRRKTADKCKCGIVLAQADCSQSISNSSATRRRCCEHDVYRPQALDFGRRPPCQIPDRGSRPRSHVHSRWPCSAPRQPFGRLSASDSSAQASAQSRAPRANAPLPPVRYDLELSQRVWQTAQSVSHHARRICRRVAA